MNQNETIASKRHLARQARVNVLIIGPSMRTFGGQSVQASLLLQHLRSEKTIDPFFQPIDPDFPRYLALIRKVRYLRTLPSFLLYCIQVLRAIYHADVIHVFAASYFSFLLAPTPAIVLARLLRKPVLLNYHSGEAADHLRNWPSAVRTIRLASKVVVPSAYLVDVFSKYGIKAHVIHNIVDLSAFRYRHREKPGPRILSNRNFEPHYNVEGVVRAFEIVQKWRPDASLTIAGDGPQKQYLQQLVTQLGLRNVRFIGRVHPERMAEVYDQHDIWLNASNIDNMPLSILEAYACGVAVVTTDAGGIPYIVENNRTGKMVPCGDMQSLANAVIEILTEPRSFATLTTNGVNECQKYAWSTVGPLWIGVYQELSGQG